MSEFTLARMVFGSHLYGTNTPDSDRDYKEIFIPTVTDILLQRATKTSRSRSTGDPNAKNVAGDEDVEQFSLHGYMKLLCDGQTVAVDMLFAPPSAMIESSWHWDEIQDHRHRFVSRAIKPFVGYCRAQANKYGIKGSRMAAAEAAAGAFTLFVDQPYMRLEECEATIADLVAAHPEHISIEPRVHPQNKDAVVDHLSVCGKLAPFTLRLPQVAAMYGSLFDRYGERARQAKDNQGVDWKALMHARRIQQQAVELLDTGHITFPRPNAHELLAIRTGSRPYVEVGAEIEQGMVKLEQAMGRSTLQNKPDKKLADRMVLTAYQSRVSLIG